MRRHFIPFPENKFIFDLRESSRGYMIKTGSILEYENGFDRLDPEALTRSNINLFSRIGITLFLLFFPLQLFAATYNATTQTMFNSAIAVSAASTENNLINVLVNGGVDLSTAATFPGNPPFSLTLMVNGVDASLTTPFNINAALSLQTNSTLSLIPNTTPVQMNINSLLTQGGGILTVLGNSFIQIANSGSYALNGGTLQIGGNNPVASIGGAFNLGGGTIEVIGSDLVLNLNMALTGSSVSTINTNGFNANFPANISNSGALIKTGLGSLKLSGSNSYGGGTTLSAGEIDLGSNTALGTGSLTMENGTSLSVEPAILVNTPITLQGLSTIRVDAGIGILAGVISGPGSLTKTGAGSLDLSGLNSYSGGTVINQGALTLIGAGTLSPAGFVNVNATGAIFDISGIASSTLSIGDLSGLAGSLVDLGGKTLQLNETATTNFAGVISGAGGGLTKQGSGSLTLSGANTYSGPTAVNSGTLYMNGSNTNSTTTVGSGAFLRGIGTLGDVILNGTLQPGNPRGTITAASFHFLNGSTLINEVNADGTTDLVQATTSLSIDPGVNLQVLMDPGLYEPGQTFVFAASPSISGRFSRVASNYPRYIPEIQYSSTQIQLQFSTRDFADLLPPNANQNVINVARYIDQLYDSGQIAPGSDLADVLLVLSFATPQELEDGLDTFHPASYSSLMVAQEYTILRYASTLTKRLDNLTHLKRRWGNCGTYYTWISPFTSYSHQYPIYDQLGYKAPSAGFSLGIDGFVTNSIYGGLTVGYSDTRVHYLERRGEGSIESAYVGAYARRFIDKIFVDASVLACFDQVDARRHIFAQSVAGTIDRRTKGSYKTTDASAHLGIGMEVYHRSFNVDLFGSLDWVGMYQKSFTEGGAGSLDLNVHERNGNLLRSVAGFLCTKCLGNWISDLGCSFAYDKRFQGSKFISHFQGYGGQFITHGISPSRFLCLPELTLTGLFFNERLSISAFYQAQISSRFYENSLIWDVGYKF